MKIAVAVDGSEHSIRAVEQAIHLAQMGDGSELFVLHVDQIQDVKNAHLLTGGEHALALKQAELLKPIREKLQHTAIVWKKVLLKGDPSEAIIQYVNKESMDQLFIGSRGLNRLQQLMLGSVSHRVMKYAKCPVTIVK
ncbi:MAG: universal stress protein [Kurthia sp.]|nr:universal stress protein [Candidatus Kurthia equi]